MTVDVLLLAAGLFAVILFAIMLSDVAVGQRKLRTRVEVLEEVGHGDKYEPQFSDTYIAKSTAVVHYRPVWMAEEEYFRTVCRGSWWPPKKEQLNTNVTTNHKKVTCRACINKMNHNKTTREGELIWKE